MLLTQELLYINFIFKTLRPCLDFIFYHRSLLTQFSSFLTQNTTSLYTSLFGYHHSTYHHSIFFNYLQASYLSLGATFTLSFFPFNSQYPNSPNLVKKKRKKKKEERTDKSEKEEKKKKRRKNNGRTVEKKEKWRRKGKKKKN